MPPLPRGSKADSCESPGVPIQSKPIRILILVTALVLFVGLAQFAVQKISTGPLRTLAEKKLTQALGLEVSIDELEASLLPTPHLRAEGIRVTNRPGRSTRNVLRIDRIDIGIELWPLLERIVLIDELEIKGADLHLETDSEGLLAGDPKLDALVDDQGEDSLKLQLRRLHIEPLRIFYRNNHRDVSHSLILDSLRLEAEELGGEIALDLQGRFEGSPIALSGRVGSLRELLNRTQPFPIEFQGRLFEANFEAKGTVREPWTLTGLDVVLSAEIPQLTIQGHSLPQLGTVQLVGHLSDHDGSLGLEKLRLDSTKTAPVRLSVQGSVDDLLGLREVEVEILTETLSLDFLNPLLQPRVEFSLPTIAALSVEAKLSGRDGRLDLDGSVRAVTTDDAIVMHAKGSIHDLIRDPRVDVEVGLQAKNLVSITSRIPDFPKHGAFGPVVSSARLISHDKALAAREIKVRLGDRERAWVELDGSTEDVTALRDTDLKLAFGAQSLHHLKELTELELPRTTPLEGSAAISDKDGSLGFEHLRLHGGEGSPIEIHLEAKIDDLPGRNEIEAELQLKGESSHTLGAIVGLDLPLVTPLEFHGQVKGSDEFIEVRGMQLRLGETRLLGILSGSFAPDTRPSLKAQLTSTDVRLQDLGLVRSGTASALSKSSAATSITGPGAAPSLPFERLRHVDLDLGLRFDHVGGYAGLEANDLGFTLRLEDGDLVVSDLGANYQGGEVKAGLHVDARTPRPKLDAQFQTKALNIARLISQFDDETEFSGMLDADLSLEASGSTLDSLRRSLAGNVTASMHDGNAASRIAREFVVNLTAAVFPSWSTKGIPRIGCAILDLEIEDGIASVETFLLQEKNVRITGTGQLDLVGGVYDLTMVPKVKNPGILSVSPKVHIKGPLDDPEFHSVKRTLVTSVGRGLIHNIYKAGKTVILPLSARDGRSDEFMKACQPASPESG